MVKNNPLKDSFKSSAGFSDRGSVFIKPEDMQNGMTYAITVNPESQPDLFRCNGFVDWWGEQEELFRDMRGCKLKLYCETSKTGRLHWHGFIKMQRKVIFALFAVPKFLKFASVKIREIGCTKRDEERNYFDDYADWFAYCLKLQDDMQDFICHEFNPSNLIIKNRRDVSDCEKYIET